MAGGTEVSFSKIALLISNGATPAVFEAWCGITGLKKTSNKDIGTVGMPDCTDPELPIWLKSYLISNQLVVTGSGTVAVESFQDFEDWDRLGDMRDTRLLISIDPSDGGGYYQGPALLSTWEVTSDNRAPYTFNFGVTFSGQPVWTPAS